VNRQLFVNLGLGLASLVVALQCLVVLGLTNHSYTMSWKAGQVQSISVGNGGTVLWFAGSLGALAYCAWAFRWLLRAGSRLRFAAMGLTIASVLGIIVFAGMLASGLVDVVHR
jgi:hypothetical protein